MEAFNQLEKLFDDLLYQTQKIGLTHEELDKGLEYVELESIKSWKHKFEYKMNIWK